jgi:hypothetical protein
MNLIYMARPIYGGWVTFTAHMSIKNKYEVYRIGNNTEKKKRKYGYGVEYRNLIIEDILNLKDIMITAIDKQYYQYLHLFPPRTKLVIHDPTELRTGKKKNPLIDNKLLYNFDIYVIRKSVRDYIKREYNIDTTLINHPFYQYPRTDKESINEYAVSISRIDFDKNTDIILKANKLLPEDKKITIYGAENRLYVFHKLKELDFAKYWRGKYEKTLPMLYDGKQILKAPKYMIDLSVIANDGGGTQYTFLEAIYNDCVLILHNDWIKKDNIFIDKYNCFVIRDENELKDILDTEYDLEYLEKIRKNAKKILINH